MAFLVKSSPRAGHLFEPSRTVPDASTALIHAVALSHRGMRLIKIKDTETGEVFDERGFRQHMEQLQAAVVDEKVQ